MSLIVMKTIAYSAIPGPNGEFTFYQEFRSSMRTLGWDVFCVSLGSIEYSLWDHSYSDSGCIAIAQYEKDIKVISSSLQSWFIDKHIEIFMTTSSDLAYSCLDDLPLFTRVVSRISYINDIGYKRIHAKINKIQAVVATSPRQLNDFTKLCQKEQFINTFLIPNGINIDIYNAEDSVEKDCRIRIIYAGKIENTYKNVLSIPFILHHLYRMDVKFHFSLVGDGPEREKLLSKLEPYRKSGTVNYIGNVNRSHLISLYKKNDIILFPSYSEGFGFVLIEAMACGCVPVASDIMGVTDFIVNNGFSGILCKKYDPVAFAQAIYHLSLNSKIRYKMREQAINHARSKFNSKNMAIRYNDLLINF